jgi:hypothetical protein
LPELIGYKGGITTEDLDLRAVAKTLNFFLKIKVTLRRLKKSEKGKKRAWNRGAEELFETHFPADLLELLFVVKVIELGFSHEPWHFHIMRFVCSLKPRQG